MVRPRPIRLAGLPMPCAGGCTPAPYPEGNYQRDFEAQVGELGGGLPLVWKPVFRKNKTRMRMVSMAAEIAPLAALFIGNALADIFVGAQAAAAVRISFSISAS